MTKKVSIVVPVYNAEKTIGRCLNTIMGQSFDDFEVIIVNDGSTDGTLVICENYMKMDKRFAVVTIENGGVSNARNVGVKKATGKYLTFVDSDDMIHPDYLKEMVDAMERYETGLVISDLVLIDFAHPSARIVLSGDSFARKKPLVLDETEFKNKTMELIWKTSLLESGCGKLVDLKIWKDNKIKLDIDLSLGEDFTANLEYYKYAKGVVFLNRPLYYYDNVDKSGSLSHKYRQDLFEIKMKLVENLKNYLGGSIDALSRKEKEFYYNYVAAYGMNALEILINEGKYQGYREKFGNIKTIIDDERFREAIRKATYLKYDKWRPMILEKNIRKLMTQKTSKEGTMNGPWKNVMVRKMVKFYFCDVKKMKQRGMEIDDELSRMGIRGTIRKELGKKS